MEELFNFASEIEKNLKAEAEAVELYTQLLKLVISINSEEYEEDIASIKEIISDELNHQIKLQGIYLKITGIMPNKE